MGLHFKIEAVVCVLLTVIVTRVSLFPGQYVRKGDLTIGLVLPVRNMNASRVNDFDLNQTCGRLLPGWTMQVVEFVRTVQSLNDDRPEGSKFGFHVIDSCSLGTVAMNQALIWASHAQVGEERPVFIVGARKSRISLPFAVFFQQFNIPMVDFGATIPELSDESRFKMYARTTPSDARQAAALAGLVSHFFNWTCVHLLYDSGVYGQQGGAEVRKALAALNVCRVSDVELPRTGDTSGFYRNVVEKKLGAHPSVAGVVCFCEENSVVSLLRALRYSQEQGQRQGHKKPRFLIVASDSFGTPTSRLKDLQSAADGMVTTTMGESQDEAEQEFQAWFSNSISSFEEMGQSDNPFLVEFIEDRFDCSLTPHTSKRLCEGLEMPPEDVPVSHYQGTLSAAVIAGVKALDSVAKSSANSKDLRNGSLFYQHLKKVEFTLPGTKQRFQFTKNGDGPAYYRFHSYREEKSQFRFIPFAEYVNNEMQDILTPNLNKFKAWPGPNEVVPGDPIVSNCSRQQEMCLPVSGMEECPVAVTKVDFSGKRHTGQVSLRTLIIVTTVLVAVIIIFIAAVVGYVVRRNSAKEERRRRQQQEDDATELEIQEKLFGRSFVGSEGSKIYANKS